MKKEDIRHWMGIVETIGRNIAVRVSHGEDQISKLYIMSPLLLTFQDKAKGSEMIRSLKEGMPLKVWVREGSEYIYNASLD